MFLRCALILFLVLSALPTGVLAQDSPPLNSLEVTGGRGFGFGGKPRRDRYAPAWDLALVRRLGPRVSASRVIHLGATAGFQGHLTQTLDCAYAEGHWCAPFYPGFVYLGPVAAYEARGARGSAARVGVAALAIADDNGVGTAGVQLRGDAASPPLLHISLIASARATLVPRLRSSTFAIASLGAGLRIH